jgi:hypothetical protein
LFLPYFLFSYHIIYMSALALMVCDTKAKTMSIFGYLIFERACRPIRFAQARFAIVSSAIVQKCTICMRLRYSVNATTVCKHGSKFFYPLSHFLYNFLYLIRNVDVILGTESQFQYYKNDFTVYKLLHFPIKYYN